jgi:hypothetical protein
MSVTCDVFHIEWFHGSSVYSLKKLFDWPCSSQTAQTITTYTTCSPATSRTYSSTWTTEFILWIHIVCHIAYHIVYHIVCHIVYHIAYPIVCHVAYHIVYHVAYPIVYHIAYHIVYPIVNSYCVPCCVPHEPQKSCCVPHTNHIVYPIMCHNAYPIVYHIVWPAYYILYYEIIICSWNTSI